MTTLTATLVLTDEVIQKIKDASEITITTEEILEELPKLFADLSNVDDLTDLLDNIDYWNY